MDRLPPSDASPLIRLGVCVVWMALGARAARGCMKYCRAREQLVFSHMTVYPPHPPPLLTLLPGLRQARQVFGYVRIGKITVDGAARPRVSAGGAFWGHDFGVVVLLVFGTLLRTHGLRARSHAQKSFFVYCSRGGKGRWAIGGSAALTGASCVRVQTLLLCAPCPV